MVSNISGFKNKVSQLQRGPPGILQWCFLFYLPDILFYYRKESSSQRIASTYNWGNFFVSGYCCGTCQIAPSLGIFYAHQNYRNFGLISYLGVAICGKSSFIPPSAMYNTFIESKFVWYWGGSQTLMTLFSQNFESKVIVSVLWYFIIWWAGPLQFNSVKIRRRKGVDFYSF